MIVKEATLPRMQDAARHSFTVGPGDEGRRLDELVAHNLGLSRSLAARLIKEGKVLVDGEGAKPAAKPRQGADISIFYREATHQEAVEPAAVNLDILYEDPDLVAVDKPAGLVVHPGAGEARVTLAAGLLHRYGPLPTLLGEDRPGVVHRLDRDTSGVILIARTEGAQSSLAKMFKERAVKKTYLAVAYGSFEEPEGTIDAPIARHPVRRKKMAATTSSGRPARTVYRVMEDFGELSLVELDLITGRTHQIRVHLAHIGHPVAGDLVYGGRGRYRTIQNRAARDAVKNISRQMLHAHRISLSHPVDGRSLSFTAPVPEDMARLIDLLRGS